MRRKMIIITLALTVLLPACGNKKPTISPINSTSESSPTANSTNDLSELELSCFNKKRSLNSYEDMAATACTMAKDPSVGPTNKSIFSQQCKSFNESILQLQAEISNLGCN